MILLRHTVLRNLARYEGHFRRPMHPRASFEVLRGGYSWASISTTPLHGGDTFLEACFQLLRVFAEHDVGPYDARARPFSVEDSWGRACTQLTSGRWELRPIKVEAFRGHLATLLRNQCMTGHSLLDARFDRAIVIDPTWSSLFYAGQLGSVAVLCTWATDQ